MWIKIVTDGLSDDYESKSRWISTLFIVVGLISYVYILFSALEFSSILGATLTIIGIISAYLTAKINLHIPASWTKALLIFFSGLIFLFSNISETSSIILYIGYFLLLMTINNFYLAYLTRQNSTAFAWIINALLNAIFTYLIFFSPATSVNDIGLFVAFSLIADGLTVLYSGRKIYIRP